MVLSNEPGFMRPAWGIRIENLIAVAAECRGNDTKDDPSGDTFLCFETLDFVRLTAG